MQMAWGAVAFAASAITPRRAVNPRGSTNDQELQLFLERTCWITRDLAAEITGCVNAATEIRTLPLNENRHNPADTVALLTRSSNNPIARQQVLRAVGHNQVGITKETPECKSNFPGGDETAEKLNKHVLLD